MAKRRKKPELITNIKKSNIKTELKPACYGDWERCCIKELCGKWYDQCHIDTGVKNDNSV